MKKKYKITLLSLTLLLALTISIGISYSIYEKSVFVDPNPSIVHTDEYLSINYFDGKSFEIKDFKKGDVFNKKISVSNVSSDDIYVTIAIMDIEKNSDDLQLVIYDNEDKIVYDKPITNVDTSVIKSVKLPVSKTLSYSIMIKNNGDDVEFFSANILAYKDVFKESETIFKETILNNNKVVNAITPVGGQIATENEGLIKDKDNLGEAYYFRGNVENNYVNFGNFTWRIIRINGDGSVRLILNATLDDQFVYNDDSSETEDYASKLVFNNSKIKTELDSWLTSNLSEFSKYITESSFCEDTSTFNEENNISYLNTYNRIFVDNTPSLTCMGSIVKNKVGLITADEVAYAGAFAKTSNSKYYLFSNAINGSWWTMSGSQIIPSNNTVDAIAVNRDGSLSYDKKISTQMYVRPVISLDVNSVVTGTGTVADPYVVKVK